MSNRAKVSHQIETHDRVSEGANGAQTWQAKDVLTGTLRAHPSNARTHSKKQIRQLARSIQQFGFTVPIIADEAGVILAGHGRWLAARELGLSTVPVVVLSGLSEVQKRAYLLADNKLAEKAGWDRATLAVELNSLAPLLGEAGLDISLTGFEPAEIDSLMGDLVDPEVDPADEPTPLRLHGLAAFVHVDPLHDNDDRPRLLVVISRGLLSSGQPKTIQKGGGSRPAISNIWWSAEFELFLPIKERSSMPSTTKTLMEPNRGD